MNSIAKTIFLCLICSMISVLTYTSFIPTPKPVQVPIQMGDIPDLIRRLKPVTKEKYSFQLGNDISICFNGDVSVTLALNMKNGNEYTSKGPTLKAAVNGLSSPSDNIKRALQGWEN